MTFDLTQIPSAWKGHEQFAQWLIHVIQPKVIVELGADFGYSAINLAIPASGQVYAIDSFEGDEHAGFRNAEEVCRQNVFRSGVQNLTIIKGFFFDVAKTWDLPIDLLHIDGRHRYDDIKEDFWTWFSFVVPGGVVMMHDTESFPMDVGRFFSELRLPKFKFTHSHGLGVVMKPR